MLDVMVNVLKLLAVWAGKSGRTGQADREGVENVPPYRVNTDKASPQGKTKQSKISRAMEAGVSQPKAKSSRVYWGRR